MTGIDERIGEAHVRSTGHSVQDYLARDSRPAPDILRSSPGDFGIEPISVRRYTSRDWYEREMRQLWPKVWQMACHEQEIPEVGDRTLYEVGDYSFILVRSGPDEIRAFYNSCLHRGNKLCVEAHGGHQIRCPFHGWSWDLEGRNTYLHGEWDFPQIDREKLRLPEVKVARWLGWVFINMDDDAAPFEEFLPVEVTEHFHRWGYQDRQVVARVTRVFPCNWKALQEAFIEAYHVGAVHPQLSTTAGDLTTQYDVLSDHVNRMISPTAVPGSASDVGMTEQELADDMANFGFVDADGNAFQVPEGQTARAVVAEVVRNMMSAQAHVDMNDWTDSEVIDGTEYFFFPNLMPWGCMTIPTLYRFLPHGGPDHAVMEVYVLAPTPEGSPKQKPVHRVLTTEQQWV